MVKKALVSKSLYKKILESVPIPCVDLLITNRGEFLLGKRNNKPAKGLWWVIGGRVLKGEKLKQAVLRKARDESGFTDCKIRKQVWVTETIFKNSARGPAAHTVNVVYLVEVKSRKFKVFPREYSKMRWFKHIDPKWHPYVKESLKKAGFK